MLALKWRQWWVQTTPPLPPLLNRRRPILSRRRHLSYYLYTALPKPAPLDASLPDSFVPERDIEPMPAPLSWVPPASEPEMDMEPIPAPLSSLLPDDDAPERETSPIPAPLASSLPDEDFSRYISPMPDGSDPAVPAEACERNPKPAALSSAAAPADSPAVGLAAASMPVRVMSKSIRRRPCPFHSF